MDCDAPGGGDDTVDHVSVLILDSGVFCFFIV